jgi:hypothetical protein
MEKWVLIVTFGNLTHMTGVYLDKDECIRWQTATGRELVRTGKVDFLSACMPERMYHAIDPKYLNVKR